MLLSIIEVQNSKIPGTDIKAINSMYIYWAHDEHTVLRDILNNYAPASVPEKRPVGCN